METSKDNYSVSQVDTLRQRSLWLWLIWSLWLFLSMYMCAFGALPTVNVLVDLKDARLQSAPNYTNRTVWVQAMSIPTASSPSVILSQPLVYTTDMNGQFWVSNLVVNLYAVTVRAPPKQENFKFLVITNYPTEINAADYLVADSAATFPAGSVAWAAAVTDFRYGGTVPRPAPADGWMLTLSNNVATWTLNGGSLTNLGANGQFIFSNNGNGTNADFKWILTSPTVWTELSETDPHTVALRYFSGTYQTLWHSHDNAFHFDSAPTFDYTTVKTVPYFDSSGTIQSLGNHSGTLTNDGSGNVGWYIGFASQTNYVATLNGGSTNQFLQNLTTYHVDQVGDPWAFNGQEFWDTNYSSVFPVGRFLGGAVPSFTVNGQILAEKPGSSSSPPLISDVSSPFSSDMFLGRSNGLPRFHITFDGGIQANGNIISTNGFQSLSASVDTLAYWNPSKVLSSLGNASGVLTNDGFGVLGWQANLSIATLNGIGTNTSLLNPSLTNGINYGNAFSSPGTGSQSEQFGASATATATQSTALGNQAQASATSATALGVSSLANAVGASALGQLATASGVHSTAIGFGATTTTDHQIQMGTSSEYANFPGPLSGSSITNRAASAGTVATYDANKKLINVANGTGWLHNDNAGTFTWSTPTFDVIGSGENDSAIMRVGSGSLLYPTNLGKIFANYATNVPLGGAVGGLNVTGTGSDTQFQQSQGYPTLDFNATMNSGVGTLFVTGDFSDNGNETNRSWTSWGVTTNDTNGKKYNAPYLVPQLMGTNILTVAGTNIAVLKSFASGVTTYTIEGITPNILPLNNIFTGSNHFSGNIAVDGTSLFSSDVDIEADLKVLGGITNSTLTANTVLGADTNKRIKSFANAFGAHTNDGSGNIGWYPGFADTNYVTVSTNQLAIATTNRINALGANATNNDLLIGQNATNWVNIQYTNAITYTSNYVFGATNVLDTIADVNAKITAAATNHVYVRTTDARVVINTNTSTGPTLYTFTLSPGITNFDNTGFEVTNTSAATSFGYLGKTNLVIKGVAPNVALGTETNAMYSLNGVDFMFKANGTNALSITNTGNGINIHGYWPLDLAFNPVYFNFSTAGMDFWDTNFSSTMPAISLHGGATPTATVEGEINVSDTVTATNNVAALVNVAAGNKVIATNGVISYATGAVSGFSNLGFTNDVAHSWGTNSVAVRVIGTGQTINFYVRSGARGQTSCGTLLYTESSGADATYPVGVNDGFSITGGTISSVNVYAFP